MLQSGDTCSNRGVSFHERDAKNQSPTGKNPPSTKMHIARTKEKEEEAGKEELPTRLLAVKEEAAKKKTER